MVLFLSLVLGDVYIKIYAAFCSEHSALRSSSKYSSALNKYSEKLIVGVDVVVVPLLAAGGLRGTQFNLRHLPPYRVQESTRTRGKATAAANAARVADFRPFLGSRPQKSPTVHRVSANCIAM